MAPVAVTRFGDPEFGRQELFAGFCPHNPGHEILRVFGGFVPWRLRRLLGSCGKVAAADDPLAWPEVTTQAKPHAYWWWMASAVDTNNIAKSLARYRDAGMGGVHHPDLRREGMGVELHHLSQPEMDGDARLHGDGGEAARAGSGYDDGQQLVLGGPKVTDEEATR